MTIEPHLEVVCSLLVGESAANDVIACQLLILSTCLEVSLHSQALLAEMIVTSSRYIGVSLKQFATSSWCILGLKKQGADRQR